MSPVCVAGYELEWLAFIPTHKYVLWGTGGGGEGGNSGKENEAWLQLQLSKTWSG